MANLSLIGLVGGAALFAFGFLMDPKRPWWIVFGLLIALGSAYAGGII